MSFCKLLKEALVDELKAHTKEYPKLLAKSEEMQDIMEPEALARFREDVLEIINDEERHYHNLRGKYETYCLGELAAEVMRGSRKRGRR